MTTHYSVDEPFGEEWVACDGVDCGESTPKGKGEPLAGGWSAVEYPTPPGRYRVEHFCPSCTPRMVYNILP